MDEQQPDMATPQEAAPDLSVLLINLLKSVLYRDTDEQLWGTLLQLQALVRDYVMVLNLELVLDEAEGYAFLKSKPEPDEGSTAAPLPRLVARRQLSFPVSLLLALLRKRLAEFDAGAGDTRLVLSRDDMVDLIRVFLADSPNEVKLIDQIEATINKVVDLGFLRKLKQPGGTGLASYEVRRILKAFVDAQWLADFDTRLGQYQQHLNTTPATNEGHTDE